MELQLCNGDGVGNCTASGMAEMCQGKRCGRDVDDDGDDDDDVDNAS